MITVDDWRQGANSPVLVINDWVDRGVADNMKVFPKILIVLIELHQSIAVHYFLLVKRSEGNFTWRKRFIGERAFNGIKVMSSHRYKRALAAQILMKFILESDKRVVAVLREGNVS